MVEAMVGYRHPVYDPRENTVRYGYLGRLMLPSTEKKTRQADVTIGAPGRQITAILPTVKDYA